MPRFDRFRLPLACVLVYSALPMRDARADVRLPTILGDHMMLQCDVPVRIWGWADPGENVTVSLARHVQTAAADRDGKWRVELPPTPASGPYDLTVQAKNKLVLTDVLVGEVWLGSGQSNMAWIVFKANNGGEEVRAANYPKIRVFTVRERNSPQPADDVEGEWFVCSPRTISYFSAVAYFFGRELHHELKVPVGLIVSAVNGTRIEPWTNAQGVDAIPELRGVDIARDGELYNGMIHPLAPFAIRGFIWYQGEGNVGDKLVYYPRMRALVQGWRTAWGNERLPFYYVQVAPLNWGGKPKDELPKLWEAQSMAQNIPHTGMVVINDIGNTGDAHPRNKQDVGKRLARWALAKTYGKPNIDYASPMYRSMKVEGQKIRVQFDHAEGGLAARGGKPLSWFTIAGEDRRFVEAQAQIDGPSVVVWNDAVKEPLAVRFAWHQVAEPNLMNRAGLPAPTFRTDSWPGSIEK